MQTDVLFRRLKQFRDLILRQPDGFVFQANVQTSLIVLCLIEKDTGLEWFFTHRGTHYIIQVYANQADASTPKDTHGGRRCKIAIWNFLFIRFTASTEK
jgi:hypothetical protein